MHISRLASVTLAVAFTSAPFAQADDFKAKAAAAFQPVVKQYDIPGLIVGITATAPTNSTRPVLPPRPTAASDDRKHCSSSAPSASCSMSRWRLWRSSAAR